MESGKQAELCYWVVAFIDLLGQGDKMDRLNSIPESPEKDPGFQKLIKDTFFAIDEMHRSCAELFEMHMKRSDMADIPSEISEERYESSRRSELKFQRFSDGLVAFVSQRNTDQNLPVNGVNALFNALGVLMLSQLAKGKPFRCGVDVGIGMEMNPNELYGPAVKSAYDLESKVAQYPRIVVGDRLRDYLRILAEVKSDSDDGRLSAAHADVMLKRLVQDMDGHWILNYLGEQFLNDLNRVSEARYMIDKAHAFVLSELEIHKQSQNSKLAFRYCMLDDYFEANRAVWESIPPYKEHE